MNKVSRISLLWVVTVCLLLFSCSSGNRTSKVLSETAVVEPTTAPIQVIFTREQLEGELLRRTNEERAKAGLAPLTLDAGLTKVARLRSEDMSARDYLSHDPPDGCAFLCLMDQLGIVYGYAGENIGWNNYPMNQTANVIATDLWNSPKHRENILDDHYRFIGIGYASDGQGKHYFTEIFNNLGSCSDSGIC